jgi:hypothetical protein
LFACIDGTSVGTIIFHTILHLGWRRFFTIEFTCGSGRAFFDASASVFACIVAEVGGIGGIAFFFRAENIMSVTFTFIATSESDIKFVSIL